MRLFDWTSVSPGDEFRTEYWEADSVEKVGFAVVSRCPLAVYLSGPSFHLTEGCKEIWSGCVRLCIANTRYQKFEIPRVTAWSAGRRRRQGISNFLVPTGWYLRYF